ncbi:MAG: peptidylprolyl isomerase [bacterium]|jgi:peptidyl-prolyl cis-trans isomerase SurA|nr:peptidylprolyl isomerase [bacterium]
MKLNRLWPACLLACLLLTPCLAQETIDRVLVVVDEEIILESEVGQELQRYLMEHKIDPQSLGDELEELKFELVQSMIDGKVLYAAARADTNIVIPEKEVERRAQERLDDILRQVGGQRRLEELMGQPLRTVRKSLTDGMRERLYVEEAQRRRLGKVEVTRQEVQEFHRAWQDSLPQVGESVRLSHIFLAWKPSPTSERRARVLADSLRALLAAEPGRFSELATAFSQDAASAASGGSIGRTKRGSLVRPYEEAAYRLAAGEISDPVRSDYGWHIVRLDQRQGEYIESSHILVKLEPTAEDRQHIHDRADSLFALLQGGADFAALARRWTDHALTRENGGDLGWLELSQLQPLVRSRVRELQAGETGRPIRSEVEGQEGVQILRVMDHRAERRPSLEADWSQIETMALNMKKQRLLKEWATQLRERVFIRVVD